MISAAKLTALDLYPQEPQKVMDTAGLFSVILVSYGLLYAINGSYKKTILSNNFSSERSHIV